MNLHIMTQLNPVFECNDILMRYYSGHTYALLKKEVISRLEIRIPEIEALLDDLQEVASEVTKDFPAGDESASYLFSPLGNQDSTLADAFLQYYGDFSEQDLSRIETGILVKFRKDPLSFLSSTLDNFNLLNLGSSKKELSDYSLMELMEICILSDESKWHLLAFYQDFESYLSKFLSLLSPAVTALSSLSGSLTCWTAPFFEEFPHKITEQNLYQYMAEKFQIILPDTDSIIIQPTLFGCSRLKYLAASRPNEYSNMLWGIHFETIYSNRLKQNSSTYICYNLKLLSDKSKFDILRLLARRSYYSGELAKELGLTTSTIAHHMQALQSAHFVSVDKRSTYRTYYKLNEESLNHFLEQVHRQLFSEE